MPVRFRSRPFDDPAVRSWDAFVLGDLAGSARESLQTFNVLEQLTALDTPVEIDSGFFEDLQARLFNSNEDHQRAALLESPPVRLPGIVRELPTNPRYGMNRRLWWMSAAALLAVVIFGAISLFQLDRDPPAPREIPAAVDSVEQQGPFDAQIWGELLLGVTVDPASLGGAPPTQWDRGEFRQVTVPAGTAFSTDNAFFQCCSGVSVYRVQEGSITVTAEGRIEVYPEGYGESTTVDDGSPVVVGPGGAVVMASEVPATFANASAELDVDMLHSMVYAYHYELGDGIPPQGYEFVTTSLDAELEALPADRVNISFESVHLAPRELLPIDLLASERILGFYPEPDAMVRIVSGAHDELPPEERGTFLVRTFTMDIYDPGEYTLFNASDTAATIYLVRVAPVVPLSLGTPVGQTAPEPHSVLLDVDVDPASLGAQGTETWDRMEFSLVTVAAGEQFTTDHPYFTCCAGIASFQIREGNATFIVDGPIDVYSGAGEQPPVRIEPQTLIPLEAGQTAVFAMDTTAVVTNVGTGELVMLGAYAYDFTDITGANAVPPGYRDELWVVDFTMAPLPAGTVNLELETVTIEPGELTRVELTADERLVGWHSGTSPEQQEAGWETGMTTVRLATGAVQQLPEDPLKSSLINSLVYSDLTPGTYTLVNTGERPANIYFMRLSPTSQASNFSVAASPSPVSAAVPLETLFDVTVDPLLIDAPAPQG